MSALIPEDSLTAAQRATLSNTICGDLESALELERIGLLTIRHGSKRGPDVLAFFDLTDAGESFVNRYHVIPLSE